MTGHVPTTVSQEDPPLPLPRVPINLVRGWPSTDLLPIALLRGAADAVLSDWDTATDALSYGPDPGYEPGRVAIAALLSRFYTPGDDGIDANRFCITGGASQSLGGLLSTYTDPEYTRNVWIVAPAYMLVFRIFVDEGFSGKMRGVPEDEEGIDLAFLRRAMGESEEAAECQGNHQPRWKGTGREGAKVYKHIIYCVPTFSNPSGRTMSLRRREDLVRLAREFDALIVPDDVYDFLQWPSDESSSASLDTAQMPRLVDIDRELDGGAERPSADGFGNACSNGTFSKIAGPGIRMGWVEGTAKFTYGISQWGAQASGGAPSQLTSCYLTHLLTTGQLEQHIRDVLRPAYASRYRVMMRAVSTHLLPLGFSLTKSSLRGVAGGYFVWLTLPAQLDAEVLASTCQVEEDLTVAHGGRFQVPGDVVELPTDDHIRLCFAWEDEWKLEEGVMRLSAVANRFLNADRSESGTSSEVAAAAKRRGVQGMK